MCPQLVHGIDQQGLETFQIGGGRGEHGGIVGESMFPQAAATIRADRLVGQISNDQEQPSGYNGGGLDPFGFTGEEDKGLLDKIISQIDPAGTGDGLRPHCGKVALHQDTKCLGIIAPGESKQQFMVCIGIHHG